jgi:hypothetical protein
MDVVPEMDGIRTFRNKKGSWAGSKHFKKIPTSEVWFSNFVQTFITVLTGSAYSIQFHHKATTVPFITTTHGSHFTLSAFISKQKEKEGTLFLSCQICLLRIKKHKTNIVRCRKRVIDITEHTIILQKIKKKKTMYINHTATISINYKHKHKR